MILEKFPGVCYDYLYHATKHFSHAFYSKRWFLWVTHQQPRFPSFENNSVDLLCPTALQLWSNVKATAAPIWCYSVRCSISDNWGSLNKIGSQDWPSSYWGLTRQPFGSNVTLWLIELMNHSLSSHERLTSCFLLFLLPFSELIWQFFVFPGIFL